MRLEDFLAQNLQTKSFQKGIKIFTKGDQADLAYFIIEGRIEIFEEYNSEETLVAILGPGDILGEMALLRFDEYTLSSRAAEDTKVHVITPDFLHEEVQKSSPLVKAILSILIDRLHDANETLINLEKVARF